MTQYLEHWESGAIFFDPPVSVSDMNYLSGFDKPRYPLPATIKNACIAAPYRAIMPITKAFLLRFKD